MVTYINKLSNQRKKEKRVRNNLKKKIKVYVIR